MNDDKLFELMTKMYSEMREGFKEVKNDISEVKDRLDKVEKTVTCIENEHGKKLDTLFDGYKQNSDKLDRIEEEVSKHEEIILRHVK